jgi:cbb3-type cytochrome oxidase subunit 1
MNPLRTDSAPLRAVVLSLLVGSACWLIAGVVFASIALIKLLWPGFLGGAAFLTFGRIAPVATNSLVYGWALPCAFAIAFWLLARLGSAPIKSTLPLAGCALWNSAVFLGVCGILSGYGNSFFLLEFPGFVGALLLIAFLCMGLPAVRLFCERARRDLYASSWYAVLALLSFPWLYASAQLLLIWKPIPGSAQAPVAAWFSSGIAGLCLAPIALAAAYYLVPQVIGRRLVSYSVAPLAFWSFALFTAWNGTVPLIGGPVPAWMTGAGMSASVLLIIPLIIISKNLLGTLRYSTDALSWSPALRFTAAGLGAFLLAAIVNLLLSIPSVSGQFQFTDVVLGLGALVLFGFFGAIAFGAIHHILPRLTGHLWIGESIQRYFWMYSLSTATLAGSLVLGGIIQGFALGDKNIAFAASLTYAAPFRLLALLATLGLLAASLYFAAQLLRMLLAPRRVVDAKQEGVAAP